METRTPGSGNPDSENISSDHLSRAEINEICEEINARNKERQPLHELATTVDSSVRQSEDAERSTTIYPIEQNPYSEDRRRISYAAAFWRLARKTQSLTVPTSAHVTNRITHTIEVVQTAKPIARAVGANEDLVEAIAMGHDLGHVSFGHNGEGHMTASLIKTRADILQVLGAFKHNVQSLHVVDRVEARKGFDKGYGLNLSDQVRHGILSHDGEKDVIQSTADRELMKDPSLLQEDIRKYVTAVVANSTYTESDAAHTEKAQEAFKNANKTTIKPGTLEAAIVAMSDVLTYAPEDFEDQVRLGIIRRQDLPLSIQRELGNDSATMINRLISDLIVHSYHQIHSEGNPTITYSEKIGSLVNSFKRDFLYTHYPTVNSLAAIHGIDARVRRTAPDVQDRFDYLFERFVEALMHPERHPQSPIQKYLEERNMLVYTQKMDGIYGPLPDDEAYAIATAMDYIAGFTDDYFFKISDEMYR